MNQAPGIQNHLVFAIIATVVGTIFTVLGCCCLPLALIPGIVAIVKANKVNAYLAANNVEAADQASREAKTWCWVTVGVGALGFVLFVIGMLMNVLGDGPSFLEAIKELERLS
jgi:Interferon-induced transmembrane protein